MNTVTRILARTAAGLAVAAATLGTAGTAFADTTPAPVHPLTVTGDVTGTVTDASASCIPLVDGYYSWELKGQVDGAPIDISFNTANFHGAGVYHATGITDDEGGLVVLESGATQVVTDGANVGTFTIDPADAHGRLRTGSINTDLNDNGQHVHVQGSWTCG